MKSSKGFSLIEMLAATVILGVLITVVLAPLAQLFEGTSRSGQRLRANTQAQELTEAIRGQWQSYPVVLVNNIDQNTQQRLDSRSRYDSTCGTLPTSSVNYRITVKALDRNAAETSTLVNNAAALRACGSVANTALLKRVTVITTGADGTQSTLTMDIPRP